MNKPLSTTPPPVSVNWQKIDTVLLDMDGTLLDKYFDDYFWEKHVPKVYAEKHQLSAEEAEAALLAKYRSVENTLQWTDLHYWTDRLDLDIPQLKKDIQQMIQVHANAVPFLQFIRNTGKKLCLVTNAHSITLEIKLARTDIGKYFDVIVCSEEVGEAKEKVSFWKKLENHIHFDRETTLFADDTEKVLHSARTYGIEHLIHVAKPSSRLPVKYSREFQSISDFGELLNG